MRRDLVILGGGPAGMSAAITAAELGLDVLLLDEQPRVGGQIHRNVGTVSPAMNRVLGPDYRYGRQLKDRLERCGAHVWHNTTAWDVSRDLRVAALQDGRTFEVQAAQLIAAPGALERPSPIPGWTLPGVMNAGAAQIALKSGGYVPGGRVALVGAGPLLLLVACQLLEVGCDVVALVETTSARQRWIALRHLPGALRAPEYLIKGMKMLRRLRASGIGRFRAAHGLEILGTEQVTGLRWHCGDTPHTVELDTVLLHHGVIPNQQLSRLLRVEHAWDPAQLAWRVACDEYGQTSLPGFRVAGDASAIVGAVAARASGALAALGAAHALGRIDAASLRERSAEHTRVLRRHLSIRPFLDALYRPPSSITCPPDDVLVCRCEEVSAGQIRGMAALGCLGPNQTKFFSRCGMGPCQGRICGTVVTQLLAESTGTSPQEIGTYRVRAPLRPIRLSALAGLHASRPSEARAVQLRSTDIQRSQSA